MTYRDISFCMRSQEQYCKDNNLPLCYNKDCFRHSTTIPTNLPEYELICWADMANGCKFYRRVHDE